MATLSAREAQRLLEREAPRVEGLDGARVVEARGLIERMAALPPA